MSAVDAKVLLCDHGIGSQRCRASFERGTSSGIRVLAAAHGWVAFGNQDYCPVHAPLYWNQRPDDT